MAVIRDVIGLFLVDLLHHRQGAGVNLQDGGRLHLAGDGRAARRRRGVHSGSPPPFNVSPSGEAMTLVSNRCAGPRRSRASAVIILATEAGGGQVGRARLAPRHREFDDQIGGLPVSPALAVARRAVRRGARAGRGRAQRRLRQRGPGQKRGREAKEAASGPFARLPYGGGLSDIAPVSRAQAGPRIRGQLGRVAPRDAMLAIAPRCGRIAAFTCAPGRARTPMGKLSMIQRQSSHS